MYQKKKKMTVNQKQVQFIISTFYNPKIQLAFSVITDILENVVENNLKMLVFGLGYDSLMWLKATDGNTFFVEDNDEYINLNKGTIPDENIIKYSYRDISVSKSFILTEDEIKVYSLPEKLQRLGQFDVILIDGPEGYTPIKPGRLLPIYWTKKYLSKKDSIIYIDDSNRDLEKFCVCKYFNKDSKQFFSERTGTERITII